MKTCVNCEVEFHADWSDQVSIDDWSQDAEDAAKVLCEKCHKIIRNMSPLILSSILTRLRDDAKEVGT